MEAGAGGEGRTDADPDPRGSCEGDWQPSTPGSKNKYNRKASGPRGSLHSPLGTDTLAILRGSQEGGLSSVMVYIGTDTPLSLASAGGPVLVDSA